MMQYLLIQSTQAPYSSSFATDAYEAALAATNIGLYVKFVCVGDGIYQLSRQQQSGDIAHKNMAKKLSALPLFDIEDIYVLNNDLSLCGLSKSDLLLDVTIIEKDELNTLCDQAHQVLVF